MANAKAKANAVDERFVTVTTHGGLGNRLFEMAAAFGLAAKRDRTCALPLPQNNGHNAHSRVRYEDTVFRRFRRLPTDAWRTVAVHDEVDDEFHKYVPCTLEDTSDAAAVILLRGYFQNERYLEGCKAEFVNLLDLPVVLPLDRTLFLHVRRGDYLLPNSPHAVDLRAYHARAIAHARERLGPEPYTLLVVSDDPAWCRAHLPVGPTVRVLDEPDELVTLSTMAACELGGICANSSFSWWGAFLGYRPGKVVTFPSVWLTRAPSGIGPLDGTLSFEGATVLEV